jgi:hypothetical protein
MMLALVAKYPVCCHEKSECWRDQGLARHKELRPCSGELESANRRRSGLSLNRVVGLPNPSKSGDFHEADMSGRFLDERRSTGDMPAGASFGRQIHGFVPIISHLRPFPTVGAPL